MRTVAFALSLAAVVPLSACAGRNGDVRSEPSAAPTDVAYLPRSHSHNNYDQPRPLVDAVERGFASIEVDVVLLDGQLYVAHGADEIRRDATLASLYFDPLRELIRRRGGRVYGPSDPPLQLLIDVKSDANETYEALQGLLDDYADIVTTWTDGMPVQGPLTVVISGNRAMELIGASRVRRVAIAGRMLDTRTDMTPDAMPLVSEDWEQLGPSTNARLAAAQPLVEQVHAEGRKVRFWGTPDEDDVWRALLRMGVDYIGTDDLRRLERLLRRMAPEETAGGR